LRTWTNRSGAFKTEAQFIGLTDGQIHLHKKNGVQIVVPASKIAQADLKYIEMVTSVDDGKLLEKKADTRDIHPRRDRAGGSKSALDNLLGVDAELQFAKQTSDSDYEFW
jgi:actin cytoskeleton-regulatory complex protein SLA1